jgi:hypothetical protein
LNFINLLEDYRDLSLVEWNFRALLEDKLVSLLHQQRVYWKQRGTIKWATLGDASTKFFHANATIRHRRNLITQLTNVQGQPVFQHQEKAELIWQAFRERLGSSNLNGLTFDLAALLGSSTDLSGLTAAFTKEEIDAVVRSLPVDKSPGPDGFNIDFIKNCWPIICNDFYDLCSAFCYGNVCLRSINGSFITLIPKKR